MSEILEGYRKRDPETGLIFPWYTWPCLDWLKGLDLKDKTIFEYGVGDSTLWYRAKGALVWGVDSNVEWANKVWLSLALGRGEYIECINYGPREGYDIIVIDGSYRDDCTELSLANLKPGGYLIIDNYHQASVEPNIWTETDRLIKGMATTIYYQPGHNDWKTAVITKP